jgi:hypothetical protein
MSYQGGLFVELPVFVLQVFDLLLEEVDADVAQLKRRRLFGHIARVDLKMEKKRF